MRGDLGEIIGTATCQNCGGAIVLREYEAGTRPPLWVHRTPEHGWTVPCHPEMVATPATPTVQRPVTRRLCAARLPGTGEHLASMDSEFCRYHAGRVVITGSQDDGGSDER